MAEIRDAPTMQDVLFNRLPCQRGQGPTRSCRREHGKESLVRLDEPPRRFQAGIARGRGRCGSQHVGRVCAQRAGIFRACVRDGGGCSGRKRQWAAVFLGEAGRDHRLRGNEGLRRGGSGCRRRRLGRRHQGRGRRREGGRGAEGERAVFPGLPRHGPGFGQERQGHPGGRRQLHDAQLRLPS